MIAIVEAELPIGEVVRAVEAEQVGAAGALVTFVGTVRNNSQGHSIEYLEYQAYKSMAEREMHKIARAVRERWGLSCAMVHRVGRLKVGEASVVVVVAAPHRKEAFTACQYAVDRLKQSVPIWKKEVATDGSWWVDDPVTASLQNAGKTQQRERNNEVHNQMQ